MEIVQLDNINLSQIQAFGAFGYSGETICALLEINNIIWFESELNNTKSDIYKAYIRGEAKARFNRDTSLLEQTQDGKVFEILAVSKVKKEEKVAAIKDKLFGI